MIQMEEKTPSVNMKHVFNNMDQTRHAFIQDPGCKIGKIIDIHTSFLIIILMQKSACFNTERMEMWLTHEVMSQLMYISIKFNNY